MKLGDSIQKGYRVYEFVKWINKRKTKCMVEEPEKIGFDKVLNSNRKINIILGRWQIKKLRRCEYDFSKIL